MRALLQRVKNAAVSIAGEKVASINEGLLVLVGFGLEDEKIAKASSFDPDEKGILAILEKMLVLRIFPDTEGRMNESLLDRDGELLLVSQFTLYADTRKGRRPSFQMACPPEAASVLFDRFCEEAEKRLPGRVKRGVFASEMDITLTNWGPVTIMLDGNKEKRTTQSNHNPGMRLNHFQS